MLFKVLPKLPPFLYKRMQKNVCERETKGSREGGKEVGKEGRREGGEGGTAAGGPPPICLAIHRLRRPSSETCLLDEAVPGARICQSERATKCPEEVTSFFLRPGTRGSAGTWVPTTGAGFRTWGKAAVAGVLEIFYQKSPLSEDRERSASS